MAARAPALSEVAGERANVCPGAAAQVDSNVDRAVAAVDAQHVDRINGHRPRCELHRLTGPGRPVRRAPTHLPSAEDQGPLVEGPDERSERRGDGALGWERRIDQLEGTLRIVGGAALSQPRSEARRG